MEFDLTSKCVLSLARENRILKDENIALKETIISADYWHGHGLTIIRQAAIRISQLNTEGG